MTRWTETSALEAEVQEPLFPTIRTPDAGKSAHRLTAVQMLFYHLLDHRTEIAVLLLKPALILPEKSLKIVEEYTIEDSALWVTLAIDPCHGGQKDSECVPGC